MADSDKKFSVSSTAPAQRLKFIDSIIADMKGKMHRHVLGGMLLAGDPGVGKTSFVRQLSRLLGMTLVLIETPHLVEEHIINIPFIVYHPESDASKSGVVKSKGDDFDIELADSDLYNQVMKSKKLPDSEVLAKIKSDANLFALHQKLGGTETAFSKRVQQLRENFNCILFLDEYYRETSTSIRNMLRGILNRNLGLHELPDKVYCIYASNMNDEGIEEVALNQDYRKLTFNNPGKQEWFTWFVNKFQHEKHVKLDMRVIDKFFNALEENDLSSDDAEADVRTSPRRWEQLLLLINASLPVKSEKEAHVLMSQVHLNFENYETGAKAKLVEKVSAAVAELIKETSHIMIGPNDTHPIEHWRDVLKHQLEVKMKLNESRSYVPVISGLPGIGKTSHIQSVAWELGLVPVMIETDKLTAEDVIGLPVPGGKSATGSRTIKFSEAMLYKVIMNKIKEGEKILKEHLKTFHLGSTHGSGELRSQDADPEVDWKEFQSREHKYLIFFDELNRVPVKTFNALRRILLDKTFVGEPGHEGTLELPKGSIIVAAINPSDGASTTSMTKHMRDVLDIIPTGSSWNQTVTFLKTKLEPEVKKELENPEIAKPILEILLAFHQHYSDDENKGKHGGTETEFHMLTGSKGIYISPREFSDLYTSMCNEVDIKIERFKEDAIKEEDPAEVEKMAFEVKSDLYDVVHSKLSFIIENKHKVENPEFFEELKSWFLHSEEADKLDLVAKKAKTLSFEEIFKKVYDDENMLLADNGEFINYIQNGDPAMFKRDLTHFLITRSTNNKAFYLDEVRFLRELQADGTTIKNGTDKKTNKSKVTHFEHFIREILNAIFMHGLSKEYILPLKQSINELLGSPDLPDESLKDLGAINSRLSKYITEISNQAKAREEKKK
jgi:MoxR-like ATPase